MKKNDYVNLIMKAHQNKYGEQDKEREQWLRERYSNNTIEDLKRIYDKVKKYL